MRASTWIVGGLMAAIVAAAGGTTTAAELAVALVGADGKPVANAVVMLRSDGAGPAAHPATTATIDQQGKQFQPWVQAIRVGTPVRFSNHDDITHHVYSFSAAKRFAYRLKAGEVQGPLAFDAPGVVVLGCNIHDWMVGYVFVTDAPRFLVTDATGAARFIDLAAGTWQVQVWHPGLTAASAPAEGTVKLAVDGRERLELRLRGPLRELGPRQPLPGADY